MNSEQLEAYCDWRCFAKTMRETDFSWLEPNPWADRLRTKQVRLGGNVNWDQMGMPSFKGEALVEQMFEQCRYNAIASQIVLKYWRCITVMIVKFKNFQNREFDTRAFLVRPDLHPYAVIYQSMRFIQYSRSKLATLIRLNHGAEPTFITHHKIGWAVAYNQSRGLGFNTFAVKSKLNDDVLSRIKSFV